MTKTNILQKTDPKAIKLAYIKASVTRYIGLLGKQGLNLVGNLGGDSAKNLGVNSLVAFTGVQKHWFCIFLNFLYDLYKPTKWDTFDWKMSKTLIAFLAYLWLGMGWMKLWALIIYCYNFGESVQTAMYLKTSKYVPPTFDKTTPSTMGKRQSKMNSGALEDLRSVTQLDDFSWTVP